MIVRREGRVHPHPDDSKPTAKVDPTELRRLLGKEPPPPPRPKVPRESVGINELHDDMITDVLPLVIELTAADLKPKSPSIPSIATYNMVSMMPRTYPSEQLAIVPRGSRPKLISDKIVAISKHHGVTMGFVFGAVLAAAVFLLLG